MEVDFQVRDAVSAEYSIYIARYNDTNGQFNYPGYLLGVFPTDTFVHVAMVMTPDNFSFYVGGVRQQSVALLPASVAPTFTWATGYAFANLNVAVGQEMVVDQFRASRVARYSGESFTPPTGPFVLD